MRHKKLTAIVGSSILALIFGLSINTAVQAQTGDNESSPTLKAMLVDAENKAKKQAATVDVKVTGIEIIDPAKVKEQPRKGQGHFHYQVDDGPIIATTAPKLSFHGLTPGQHKIVVTLAGNDHNPLGPQETLNVTIP